MNFKSAIFALMVSSVSADGIRSSRRLSFQLIAGYEPRTQVTDHNAIDLDQEQIEILVGKEDFQGAQDVYERGFASKPLATLTIPDTTSNINKGAKAQGTGNDGSNIFGTVMDSVAAGSTSVRIQYDTSDIQSTHVRCKVGGSASPMTSGCFQDGTGVINIGGSDYEYSSIVNTNDRTIQGFSTNAETRFRPVTGGGYFEDFQKFVNYYGSPIYADKWITAAFGGTNAGLGRFNADFSRVDIKGRSEASKKGAAYLAIGMYVIRELEDAIDDCKRGCNTAECNDDSVHALDEAVAFYTGSLEGADGSGSGNLYYNLADARCTNFKTCGRNGDEASGTSMVNHKIFRLFNRMKTELMAENCPAAENIKKEIVKQMWVPLVQGTLRYAWKLNYEPISDDMGRAEGASFTAGVLPMIHACDTGDAQIIERQMSINNGNQIDFVAVKGALERQYSCLGISCADVGGLYDPIEDRYMQQANPCGGVGRGVSKDEKKGLAIGLPVGLVCGMLLAVLIVKCRGKRNDIEFKSSGEPHV